MKARKVGNNMGIEYFNIYVKRGPQLTRGYPKLVSYTLET